MAGKRGRKPLGNFLIRLHIIPEHKLFLDSVQVHGGINTYAGAIRACVEYARRNTKDLEQLKKIEDEVKKMVK